MNEMVFYLFCKRKGSSFVSFYKYKLLLSLFLENTYQNHYTEDEIKESDELSKVIVYLKDEEYGRRLFQFLKQKKELQENIVLFHSQDLVIEYLQHDKIDIYITDDMSDTMNEMLEKVEKKIVISANTKESSDDSDQRILFYKFQSMEYLLPHLISKKVKEYQCRKNQTQAHEINLVTIFGFEGNQPICFAAKKLAEELAKKEKVLYLSFFPWDSVLKEEKVSNDICSPKSMSDLIYEIRNKTIEEIRVSDYIQKERGIDYIAPVNHSLDLLEIEAEDIEKFQQLFATTEYQTVVVGVSFFTDAMIALFENAKRFFYFYSDQVNLHQKSLLSRQISQVVTNQNSKEISIGLEKEITKEIRKLLEEGNGATGA